MGFRLNIVVSSVVNPKEHRRIVDAAQTAWPFIRSPRRSTEYDNRVLFAAPELTDYLFEDDANYEAALEQCHQLRSELPEFSRRFPGATFAHIEADCVGGTCLYCGYCCRGGGIQFAVEEIKNSGQVDLLQCIGINLTGGFPPFGRGYFSGHGSGGFI